MSDTFDKNRLTGVGSPAENAAAVRGERVPETVSGAATLCCLVRGIRYNDGLAQELHGIPEIPQITRALNARAIMSNRILEMTTPEEFPYCFWHPSLPTKQTLRELLRRYPDNTLLLYQVGRACAAGGYTDLYNELGLLPDVAIAEEARDNYDSGQMIYQAIMQAPIRYAYMDDYIGQLRVKPILEACLNGDTCVRSPLDQRYPVGRNTYPILPKVVLDITEDQRIDVQGVLPGDDQSARR
ncbi:hypothetical protein BJX64DRAFT_294356 [Aspergillus heterothallicus]